MIGWHAQLETSLFPSDFICYVFIWTPPHFWALSYKDIEYSKATVPMPAKGKKLYQTNSTIPILLFVSLLIFLKFAGEIYLITVDFKYLFSACS